MWHKTFAAILAISLLDASGPAALAEDDEASGAAVAKSVPTAKVTLQQGLTAAESQGQPISGKFEVDEGHFQLSAYSVQGGKFSQVLVDHSTGKLAKSEPIADGDDLADAKKQMQALATAKKSLKSAVNHAERCSPGYRAVSVNPKLRGGHAIAVMTLLKGTIVRSASEPLE